MLECHPRAVRGLRKALAEEDLSAVYAYASHVHDDHNGGAKKIQDTCLAAGVPLAFAQFTDESESNKLYRDMIRRGVKNPEMISRDALERELCAHIHYETLYHDAHANSTALVLEDGRAMRIWLPDNCDPRGRDMFWLVNDREDKMYFDVTMSHGNLRTLPHTRQSTR